MPLTALTLLTLTSLPLMMTFMLMMNNSIKYLFYPLLSNPPLEITLIMDWAGLLFVSTVMLITSLIILFSTSYIPPLEHPRFLLILLAFMMSMITLILSNNLFFLMLGWDGLGLTSYALVIYYQNASSSASGTITILSNRVGDIMIILAITTLMTNNMVDLSTNPLFPRITLLLLLIAAISKSAQFPFSAWLPAAMAAPTPISALVHSSTLVTAGVYLLFRLSSSPHPNLMWTALLISILTSFMAGLAALWEQDMKKIIALSTLSQIAIMVFSLSLGLHHLALFHLITHAIFKSTMFLCAGMMIHNSNYQDMRAQGSTFSATPLMSTTLGISTAALMGMPFMAGFYSKDAIMESMLLTNFNLTVWVLMLAAIGLTIAYSLRLIMMANTHMLKSKPDITIHSDQKMSTAFSTLAPLAATTGALLSWLTLPTQLILLPPAPKLTTLLIMLLSFSTCLALSYQHSPYPLVGKLAHPMWFLHPLTSYPSLKSLPIGSMAFKMDLTWHEQSSALGLHKTASYLQQSTLLLMKSPLTLLLLSLLIPIYII